MKALIETTFPILAIIAIPIIFYAGIILGSAINPIQDRHDDLTEQVFVFEEEEYIDDIPFDTKSIAENLNDKTEKVDLINYTQEIKMKQRDYHSTYPLIGLNENLNINISSF